MKKQRILEIIQKLTERVDNLEIRLKDTLSKIWAGNAIEAERVANLEHRLKTFPPSPSIIDSRIAPISVEAEQAKKKIGAIGWNISGVIKEGESQTPPSTVQSAGIYYARLPSQQSKE